MIDKGEQAVQMEALRSERRLVHTVKFFENKDDLAAKVAASVASTLSTSQASTLPKIRPGFFSGVHSVDMAESNVPSTAIAISNHRAKKSYRRGKPVRVTPVMRRGH